jgi:hypothetical protein
MLLFADETPEAGYAGSGTENFGYEKYLEGFKNAVKSSLDIGYFQSFFTELEDQAVKTSRSLASNIAGYSQSLEKSMMNVYKQTVKIGGSTKDVIDYAEAFATQTGKVPAIQDEVIVNAIKISKEFGISTKEVAQMAGEFNKIGLSQLAAVKMIRTIGESARKYGVNAGQLTKVVQENVKKSSAYTFKDGVEGLTKMAAKAQSLGVGIESAFKLYDDFMNPDNAIEFASEMQMLGGEFAAQFGDPFSNMGASVEELREKLTKSASSFAELDENGEFKISREGQKALRILAEKTGESVEDLASIATQSAKKMDALGKTKWAGNISEEDKEFVASLSTMGKEGKYEVKLPGTDNWVKTSEITSKQIEELKKKTQEGETPLPDGNQNAFNEKFLSSAERQNNTLIQIRDALILKATPEQGKSSVETLTKLAEATKNVITKIEDKLPVNDVLEYLKTAQTKVSEYINNGNLEKDMGNIIALLQRAIFNNPIVKIEDGFFPGSGSAPKIMSEGKIYEGIVGDQVAVGPDLDKTFEMSREEIRGSRPMTESLLKEYGDPFKNMTSATLQNTLGEKPTKLSEVMTNSTTNTNINTTNTQNLSGGFTITIDASKVPNSLDPTMLKNEMMKVMYQLSDEMKKQGVLNFKLK